MGFNVRKLKSAEQITKETVDGVAGSAAKWLDGYKNPRRDPQAEAKKSVKKWKLAVTDAAAEKAYQENVGSYDVEGAIRVAEEIGGNALVAGVAARAGKILKANQDLQGPREAAMGRIDAMPTDTQAQRDAKMLANVREMEKLGR